MTKTKTPTTLAPGYYVEIKTGPEGWRRFTTAPQTRAEAIAERKRATETWGKGCARIYQIK